MSYLAGCVLMVRGTLALLNGLQRLSSPNVLWWALVLVYIAQTYHILVLVCPNLKEAICRPLHARHMRLQTTGNKFGHACILNFTS